MDRLKELYFSLKGFPPATIEKLPGAGSNREYYRLADGEGGTLIGVIGTSREENHAFVYLARHFAERNLPVPKVLAVTDDELCYLQQDLGSNSLFDVVVARHDAKAGYNDSEKQLLIRTIRQLPKMQVLGAEGLDFSHCYPQAAFDKQGVFFDLNYFKYCFLKSTNLDFNELRLEESFRMFADDLTAESGDYFLYRDFQSRNVMLDEGGNPWFIDFQGGRKGPFYYDVASFLWQASARYGDSLRQQLIGEYYSALRQLVEVQTEEHFNNRLKLFVLFRTLQVLGAYGFRGYFERKQHFIKSIPPAIDNLRQLLAEGVCPYPYLREVLQQLTELPQFAKVVPSHGAKSISKYDGQGPLVVRVFSFSYRKGIPEDESGNGGGYVFDGRSTHNPGRYEQYKQLTGLDEPVIRFLEDDGEILAFLESVYRLADAHVERYIQRGFTSLMFSFGCTGGQHRSVYSAQHLAERLHKKYGIEVRICHREQNIHKTLK